MKEKKKGMKAVRKKKKRGKKIKRKREKKKEVTPDQIKQQNQRNKERLCRRKLLQHFRPGDYYLDLTCRKEDRPEDMKQMKDWMRKFTTAVRKEYKKAGAEMKWIRNIENTVGNAWHCHMVLNKVEGMDEVIRKAWPHGKVKIQLTYADGGFKDLAKYLTKGPDTNKGITEACYSTSRNLPVPEPKKKELKRLPKNIKIPAGWYMDEYFEGINPYTGFKMVRYVLLRLRDEKKKT